MHFQPLGDQGKFRRSELAEIPGMGLLQLQGVQIDY